MGKLSDVIDLRLKELGIKGSKMCDDLGMSRSTLTELRKGRAASLKAEKAAAIASYLGLSVEELLSSETEKAPTTEGERLAQNEDEEDMLFLARHMEPIPEEDRKELKAQFKKSIDMYLKAMGLSGTEDK